MRFILPFLFLQCCCRLLHAQGSPVPDHDTSYYVSYPRQIIGRVYFVKKYTSLVLEKASAKSQLSYQPTTPVNIGFGVTYHTLSANLSVGFGFLNREPSKGRTSYLDLQTHSYGRKWIADLLVQFYKGYHLNPRGLAADDPESFYKRPDMRINVVGGAAYYLFNYDRFSYRAPTIQDEEQKKSAGSFLLGGEAYYGIVKADSSLVPTVLINPATQSDFRLLRFFKIGPGAGYAYTFIIQPAFFFTASLQANLSVDFVHQAGDSTNSNRVSISPGYIYRLVGGYTSGLYTINVSLVGNQLSIKPAVNGDNYYISTGAFQLNFTRRFTPGKKLNDRLRRVRELMPVPEG